MMEWEAQGLGGLKDSEHFRENFFEAGIFDTDSSKFKKLAWRIPRRKEQETKSYEK